MGFINETEYEVSISNFMSMRKEAIVCDSIADEENRREYKTEDGLMAVAVEGSCLGSETNFDQVCKEFCRGWFDSGNLIISNDCIMPVDITGFRVSDSERFSVFNPELHRYRDVYHSGVVEELPIKLKTYERIKIPIFFHPRYEELENGVAGTFDARSGDRFGATVDIFPGIPIINCKEEGENECDSEILLTGELLCPPKDYDYNWMYNSGLLDEYDELHPKRVTNNILTVFKNKSTINKYPTFTYFHESEINTPQKLFSALSSAAEGYADYFTGDNGHEQNNLYLLGGDYGLVSSLDLFKTMVDEKISENKNTSEGNLSIESFEHVNYPIPAVSDVYEIEANFDSESRIEFLDFNGLTFKGLMVENYAFQYVNVSETEEVFMERLGGGVIARDKVVFYKANGSTLLMFLTDRGDFLTADINERVP